LNNTTRYPFDNQTCEINISKLLLNDGYETIHNNNNETNYLDNFVPNGEWEVQRITSSIKVHIRDGYMMSTPVYRIQMERLRINIHPPINNAVISNNDVVIVVISAS
jgi:hypothetical protein